MPEELAIMIVLVTFILTVGLVSIVRPIAKPLVRLIEAMIQERKPGSAARELGGIRSVLDRVEDRITMLEERQSFYEALGEPDKNRLSAGSAPSRTLEQPLE